MWETLKKWPDVKQGSNRDWKTWKMKMVMEKSWNMKNEQKVIVFCNQTWNFTNFAPEFDQICAFCANIKKFSIGLESLHFLTFFTKCRKCKI